MIEKVRIKKYLEKKFGEVKLNKIEELGKGVYGTAYLLVFDSSGKNKRLVLKSMPTGGFGHDYKADIAQNLILANDTFNKLEKHIKSYDVIADCEELRSIGGAENYYILLEEAEGTPYNKILDRIAEEGLKEEDEKKVVKLAEYLSEIHKRVDKPDLYVRRARDLVGHGEYIMGVLDGYPKDSINPERRTKIVQKCVRWWEKLKNYKHRVSVVHGDYHPFNVMFKDGNFTLLDRSRGEYGEPADDVTSMTMNYIFWSLIEYGKLDSEFKRMFELFFETYLKETGDKELFEVLQPFFTFRALVVANPIFYSDKWFREKGVKPGKMREKLLRFAENVLELQKFEIENTNKYLG